METTPEIPKPAPLTFEQVMAILEVQKAETLAKLAETLAKIEAETKARHEEFKKRDEEFEKKRAEEAQKREEEFKKRDEEAQKRDEEAQKRDEESQKRDAEHKERMENISERFGYFGNRMGSLIEMIVVPNLAKKFNEFGFTFSNSTMNYTIKDGKKTITEIDLILEDGDSIMIVEVKTKPNLDDIERHIDRMEKILLHPTRFLSGMKLYGAIACGILEDGVKEAIFKAGFYAVCQTQYNVEIIPPPEGFVAKYWKTK